MNKRILILLACALVCACASNVSNVVPKDPAAERGALTGRDIFYSDSLNASDLYRTYPVPEGVTYTPAPKGYRPVYISSYARHGSRKLIGTGQSGHVRKVFDSAEEAGVLTPLGEEIRAKIIAIDDDQQVSNGDLTRAGMEQHRGIAERMYRNYPEVFRAKGTPVRLYSTASQRTMMSMFSQNARLLELNPGIVSTRQASTALTYLVRIPEFPREKPVKAVTDDFINEHLDMGPVLQRLFTGKVPALDNPASFIRNLYNCASIACGLDLENVEFIWDAFTYDELYILQQAVNYNWYIHNSNSPYLGDCLLPEMSPLLKDFVDKADAALEQEIPGADLRFGHDSYLTSFSALLGVNGLVPQEEDPLKVIDIFQDFRVAPMAGNLQWVFFRNSAGDVLVKILQNEVEAWVPVQTDIWPYYHWNDLRDYCLSRINPDCLNPGPDDMRR